MSELQSMTRSYLEWLKELKNNKRSLNLFNLSTADKPFDVVSGYKPKKIFSTKSDYDLVTDRLNASVKRCRSREDYNQFLEMFDLGLSKLIKEKFNI